ncbi:MerR family transcriptional regulator [Tsukamurella sp. TY48]|uniref:MerR family transcriptional regulator n=1 Tax=Tsukamurella TaxID=2060 RepID=UPI001C7CE4FD|nr:MerR family transcriptional regulator [Tsukamurella sp. TY48]
MNDGKQQFHTVGAIARLTGVSVRTLHHYDDIGLVPPSGRTAAGYRAYSDADVERLHQVLTYRELGFPLEQIATLLDDPSADAMAHLEEQRTLLTTRIDRLHRMVAAVEEMMNRKKGGITLSAQDQAEIFGDDWLGEGYAEEAEQRWGDTDAWKQSAERTAKLSKDDWKQLKAEGDALEAALADGLARGVAPGSEEGNALAEQHRAGIDRWYDCDHAMHVCVARMYIDDPRFRKHYEDIAPGLAQYVYDLVAANAEGR